MDHGLGEYANAHHAQHSAKNRADYRIVPEIAHGPP
jgi:hypothetical protein